jgi:dihydrofolate synthase/folylpolyglutamate synthase
MRDKQLEQIGEILFPVTDLLVLTEVNNPRSATSEVLEPIAQRFARGKILKNDDSATALQIAVENTSREGMICVAGSLYLVGELRPLILSLR